MRKSIEDDGVSPRQMRQDSFEKKPEWLGKDVIAILGIHDVLSCLLEEQLLEPALNLTDHCCGPRLLLKSSDENSMKALISSRYSSPFHISNQTRSPSFLGLKDVPALKLEVPALTSRVCALSYWLVISAFEPFWGSLSTLVVLEVNIFPVGTHPRPNTV
ncbi:hypothetical protein Tco_0692870 [Tanacetum coccineum]